MARVVTELLPQPRDAHVDRAIERLVRVALGEIEQALAAEHAPGVLGEHAQERELVGGEAERAPVERARDRTRRIEHQPPDAELAPPAARPARAAPRRGCAPAARAR